MEAITREQFEAMLRPTRLDHAIGSIAPGWGARRLAKRRAFAYEAARNTRLRNSSAVLAGPEDYQAFPDRLQLIRQMRDLVQNFGLFQSIQDKLAMYAFGRIKFQALTGDKATNDAYEDYLGDRFRRIDASGRNNLRALTSIAFKSQLNDGDFLFKWQKVGGESRLVGVEGDRLGGIIMGSPLQNYFQGIQIDQATGAPLTYRIYKRTKANSYVDPVDVPASDIIHILDPRRVDQYRGITPFAPVVNEARDLKELMEAVRIGTKFENYHAAVGYTPSGLPLDNPADFILNGEVTNGQGTQLAQQKIEYGKIQWAPKDAKLEWLGSNRPSAQFQQYLDNLIRLIGNALCLPYGFVYNLIGLSGPSARMDAQQAHRTIQWHQENMVDLFLERAKNTLLMEGIANGDVEYTPRWMRGKWQFAPAITIDVGRDSAAMINEWKMGLRTKSSIFAEDGEDSEEQEEIIVQEVTQTVVNAKKLAEDQDIPLELALTMFEARIPNGFVPKNAPEQSVEPDGATEDVPAATDLAPSDSQTEFRREMSARDSIASIADELAAQQRTMDEEKDAS